MRRLVISVLATVTFLATSIWFVWYFAYSLDPRPADSAEIAGLGSEVSINWRSNQINEIVAAESADAFAGLGYIHGTEDTWAALILRQTAIGKLGEWFGGDAIEMDIATRMLGLDRLAQNSTKDLSANAKRMLESYSAGMNAALQTKSVRRNENLVLLRIPDIEPWESWHSIAIERLIAWLATTVNVDPQIESETAPIDLIRLLQASVNIKDWLAIDGFANSVAWALQQGDKTHLFSRIVYGSSIEGYFKEFSVAMPNQTGFSGMALVGTPFVFIGQTESRSWSVLPHQLATVAIVDSAEATTSRSRISFTDGSEQIVVFNRSTNGLYFPSDSSGGVLLSWPGLRFNSDVESWAAITKQLGPFAMLDGTSIDLQREGALTVTGPANATIRFTGGVFVGHSAWSRFPAQRLLDWTTLGQPINISALKSDTFSPWASELLPKLLALTNDSTGNPVHDEAIQYLRNWDYSFSSSSIAGAIFDTWTTRIWLTTGVRPGIDESASLDSLHVDDALRAAIDGLRQNFGADESTWRWERVQFNTRSWPLWPMIAKRSPAMSNSRFAPIRTTGRGHPSTLHWGATSYVGRGTPPGRFESWTTSSDWQWSYSSDANLSRTRRFRRTDAPVSTTINGTSPLPATTPPDFTTTLTPR